MNIAERFTNKVANRYSFVPKNKNMVNKEKVTGAEEIEQGNFTIIYLDEYGDMKKTTSNSILHQDCMTTFYTEKNAIRLPNHRILKIKKELVK